MEALYTAEQRQRVEVTNHGDETAYLAERDLERYGPDNPFLVDAQDEDGNAIKDGEGNTVKSPLTEVVYDGAAHVGRDSTIEWVLEAGATLYGDGDLEVAEHPGRGRYEGEKPEEGLGRA